MASLDDPVCRLRLHVILCSCLVIPALVKSSPGEPVPLSLQMCPKWTLANIFHSQQDQCSLDNARDGSGNSRVAELNGTTLEVALNLLQSRREAYVAVLFYAAWCPFSKHLRPSFDTLSTLFPSIYHVAVEDKAIRPRYHPFSALSQYGVHSFPSLFLQNKTVRLRYHGSRKVGSLSRFYKDITGIEPVKASFSFLEQIPKTKKFLAEEVLQNPENVWYVWLETLQKWLHDDIYLALAMLFVLLRLLLFALPKLVSGIKHHWVQVRYVLQSKNLFARQNPLCYTEQGTEQGHLNNSSPEAKFKGTPAKL